MDFKDKRILVVDDEPMVRETLTDTLTTYGATVIQAENGNQAWDIIYDMELDLILSDVRMPECSGIDLLKKIRSSNKTMPPIIMISAFQDLSVDQMKELGARDFILKSSDSRRIIELISEILG